MDCKSQAPSPSFSFDSKHPFRDGEILNIQRRRFPYAYAGSKEKIDQG